MIPKIVPSITLPYSAAGTSLVLPLGQIPANLGLSEWATSSFEVAASLPRRFLSVGDNPSVPRLWAGDGTEETETTADLQNKVSALYKLGSLPRAELLHREVFYWLQLAHRLEKKGLIANAGRVMDRAYELATELEPCFAADYFLEIYTFRAAHGDKAGAQKALSEARHRINKIRGANRTDYLGRLWNQEFEKGEEGAALTLRRIFATLNKIPKGHPKRSEQYSIIANQFISADQLELAESLIDDILPGYRGLVLSDLAGKWAQKGPLHRDKIKKLCDKVFADAALSQDVRGQNYPVYFLIRLSTRLLEAGPAYREEAIDVCHRLHRYLREDFRIRDSSNIASKMESLKDLAILFAKAQCDDETYTLIRQEIRDPECRSGALTGLIHELAKTGRFAEARALLENERMLASHRFTALMGLAHELKKRGAVRYEEASATLHEAHRIIRQYELKEIVPGRSRFLADLGTRLADAGEIKNAASIFAEARESAENEREKAPLQSRWEKQADIAIAEAASLVFPYVTADVSELFASLRSAALQGNAARLVSIATLVGFRVEGLQYGLENLATFPKDSQVLVKVGLYAGSSLLPQDSRSRDTIAKALEVILRETYTAEYPQAARIHRIAVESLKRLDSSRLISLLMEAARERLTLQNQLPQEVALKAADGSLPLNESDQLLYQTLFYIARSDHKPSQTFISYLLLAPNFPERWRRLLERILRRGGFGESDQPDALN